MCLLSDNQTAMQEAMDTRMRGAVDNAGDEDSSSQAPEEETSDEFASHHTSRENDDDVV